MDERKQKDLRAAGAASAPSHTPGPWRLATADEREESYRPHIMADTPHGALYVADVYDSLDEYGANATLIAAAPTLADALEAIANEAGDTGRNLAWARLHARAALRLAGRLP